MSYQEIITYNSASALSFDTALVEVASNTLRLKDLGGGTYSTANPIVTTQHLNVISSLTSLAENVSTPTGSAVGYCIQINGLVYYWDAVTTQWLASDQSFAQSNSASVISAHAATLFSDLGLISQVYFSLMIILNSDGSAQPALTSNTISYGFVNQNPSVPAQCLLYANVNDLLGNIPAISASQPITLNVSAYQGFFHGQRFIVPFTKSATFDANTGVVQLSLIETETPGVPLEFSITFYDGISRATVKLFNAMIPNQASSAIASITQPRNIDFG